MFYLNERFKRFYRKRFKTLPIKTHPFRTDFDGRISVQTDRFWTDFGLPVQNRFSLWYRKRICYSSRDQRTTLIDQLVLSPIAYRILFRTFKRFVGLCFDEHKAKIWADLIENNAIADYDNDDYLFYLSNLFDTNGFSKLNGNHKYDKS